MARKPAERELGAWRSSVVSRYTPESITHPGKMLPTIARYAINTYTDPGDLVLDPMAGIGTTMVEAMHLDRHGVGIEYEQRWATLAAVNLTLAERRGAPGTGRVYTGDSRQLPALLPPQIHGKVALVVTSPPYGPSTHGQVRTPGPRHGKIHKIHHHYGTSDNLAYRDHDTLATGLTDILTGCRTVLRPGGHLIITARPYRSHGELIDIPGMIVAAGHAAGLELVEECIALIAGVRNGRLIPRASFFQIKSVGDAINRGDPQWLVQHEDVIVFRVSQPRNTRRDSTHSRHAPTTIHPDHRLDPSTPARMDRRAQPAHPATANTGDGSATHTRPHPGRDTERTSDPCPPYAHPTPGSEQPDTTTDRQPTAHDRPRPPTGASDTAGRR
ncbi:DNA methyltransferase [Salinispora arenicola]|uniref:Methyltransferase n=1 Tax=Salinispora arenicola TaxID=168697 RepID=A0A542XTJ5_SALAC|nr:DNA methyltransferase [Salinispora arenicola]MCN0155107.1 site-specific DNA-methyltransferase [Salinispora arenicola]TQL39167.1 DNA methylase [Salinispora arenicola]